MRRASQRCQRKPRGSCRRSGSEKRGKRKGSTASGEAGPPRFIRITAGCGGPSSSPRTKAREPGLDRLPRDPAPEEGEAALAVGGRLGAGVDLEPSADHVEARPRAILRLDDALGAEDRLR